MSATTARLQPPANEVPMGDNGQHTLAWSQYFQSVADQLAGAQPRNGVTDGSDAAAGQIGEYMAAASGTVGLANNVVTNLISLDLTPGDWDVSGNAQFHAPTGTHTLFAAGVGGLDTILRVSVTGAAIDEGLSTATSRQNITASATVWLVVEAASTVAVSASGTIRARRMR
jgi:hypothetical protein